ncbi:alpha/beta fold hydrolase [Nocardioides sp. C4-1]|uniref:alpha/beta fold hydrolase n=1 Tax=Nocardioides sp. C4-1 TaxID=3151851 RepID=UPI003264063D
MLVRTADGVDIAYAIQGDGGGNRDTVVLVNGLGDPMEAWDQQVPALTDAGYRVVTLNNRGVSPSSAPPGPYSIEQMADDVHEVVQAVRPGQPFHLVGVSLGGAVAQRYALDHPAELASLTLLSTFAEPGAHFRSVIRLWREAIGQLGLAFVMRDAVTRCLTPEFYLEHPDEVRSIEEDLELVDMSVAAFIAQLDAIEATDLTAELASIDVPTRLVIARDDQLIHSSLGHVVAETIPGASVVSVPGGHLSFVERAEEVDAAILASLRS